MLLVQNIEEVFTKKKKGFGARKRNTKQSKKDTQQSMLTKLLFGENFSGGKSENNSLKNLSDQLSQMDSRHEKLRQKIEQREVERYLKMLGNSSVDDSIRFEKLKKRINEKY